MSAPDDRAPGRRRRAILALASGAFTIGIAEFSVTGLLSFIASDLGATTSQLGSAIAAYAVGVVIGAPLITVLAGRFALRTLLLVSVVLLILGNGAALSAPDVTSFLLARAVAGLPHGAFFAMSAAMAADIAGDGRQGRVIATVMLGQTIASIVGVPTTVFLGQTLGWRVALALVVVLGVWTLVALALWAPRGATRTASGIRAQIAHVRRRTIGLALVVCWVGFSGLFCLVSYLSPLTTEAAGLPASVVPLVLVCFGVGMTLGIVLGGRLADVNAAHALPITFGAGAVAVGALALVLTNPWAPFVGAFALGAAIQLPFPALQLRTIGAAPGAPALAASLMQSAVNIAVATGTLLGAGASAAGWSFSINALIGCLLLLAGSALAWTLSRGQGSDARSDPATAVDRVR